MEDLILIELPDAAPVAGERALAVVPRPCGPLPKEPRPGAGLGRDGQMSLAKSAKAIAMLRLD